MDWRSGLEEGSRSSEKEAKTETQSTELHAGKWGEQQVFCEGGKRL